MPRKTTTKNEHRSVPSKICEYICVQHCLYMEGTECLWAYNSLWKLSNGFTLYSWKIYRIEWISKRHPYGFHLSSERNHIKIYIFPDIMVKKLYLIVLDYSMSPFFIILVFSALADNINSRSSHLFLKTDFHIIAIIFLNLKYMHMWMHRPVKS